MELEEKQEGDSKLVEGLMDLIIAVRQKARKNKDFETADYLRDELKKLGIILEDTPQGTNWRIH